MWSYTRSTRDRRKPKCSDAGRTGSRSRAERETRRGGRVPCDQARSDQGRHCVQGRADTEAGKPPRLSLEHPSGIKIDLGGSACEIERSTNCRPDTATKKVDRRRQEELDVRVDPVLEPEPTPKPRHVVSKHPNANLSNERHRLRRRRPGSQCQKASCQNGPLNDAVSLHLINLR